MRIITGLRIEDLRTDKDRTQKETAELLHMHLTTYREYEQQKRRIPANFKTLHLLFGKAVCHLAIMPKKYVEKHKN